MQRSWVPASLKGGGQCPAFCPGAPTIAVGGRTRAHSSCTTAACHLSSNDGISTGSLLSRSHHHQLYSIEWHHRGGTNPGDGQRWAILAHTSMSDGPSRQQQQQQQQQQQLQQLQKPQHQKQQQQPQVAPDSCTPTATMPTGSSSSSSSSSRHHEPTPLPRSPSHDVPAAYPEDDDGADRLFAAARSLHLRRHRSRASRENALSLFRETMRLRPGWKETDSRFAVESGIDDVFRSFSHKQDAVEHSRDSTSDSSSSSSTSEQTNAAGGFAGSTGVASPVGWHDFDRRSSTSCDATNHDDVRCLRMILARIGYTARRVQERFGAGRGQRLPGPYYLRKNFDHKSADVVASMRQPKDALDIAIRLFLLGLALPRTQVEQSLGHDFSESADRLGMLGVCPVDSSLLVSLVQLFPLDAEALLPPPPPPQPQRRVDGGVSRSGGGGRKEKGSTHGGDGSSRDGRRDGRREGLLVTAAGYQGERKGEGRGGRGGGGEGPAAPGVGQSWEEYGEQRTESHAPAVTVLSSSSSSFSPSCSSETVEIVSASDMIFATDWPPPGSTALTEEPVMYIGPDSIGLVQHAPRMPMPMPMPARHPEPLLPTSRRRRDAAAAGGENEEGGHCFVGGGAGGAGGGGGGGISCEGDLANVSSPSVEPEAASTKAAASGGSGGEREKSGRMVVTAVVPGEEGKAERTTGGERSGGDGQQQQQQQQRRQRQRQGAENILDLCCGSGVQGIAAVVLRRGKAAVTCVDINPRAVRFSRFNALLNGLDIGTGKNGVGGRHFRAVVGDLYGALDTAAAVERSASETAGADGAPSFGDGRSAGSASSMSGLSSGTSANSSTVGSGGGIAGSSAGISSSIISSTTPSTTPPAASSFSYYYYDLILANPPFVPVPPKLGAVRRRYDVFASGGPSGEVVMEGIFRGALDRLRPGGGLLAVVTELANPRTFDAKLRRWVEGVAVGDVGVEVGNTAEKEMGDGVCSSSSSSSMSSGSPGDYVGGQEEDHPPGRGDGDRGATTRNTAVRTFAGAPAAAEWTGVVLHEQKPWTAREYAARRAGSSQEAEGWERHLSQLGIEEMSAGFVFVRRRGGHGGGTRQRPPSVTGTTTSEKSDEKNEAENGGGRSSAAAAAAVLTSDEDFVSSAAVSPSGEVSSTAVATSREVSSAVEMGGSSSVAAIGPGECSSSTGAEGRPATVGTGSKRNEEESHRGVTDGSGSGRVGSGESPAEVEIQGVEKLWAPHNRAALEISSAALRQT